MSRRATNPNNYNANGTVKKGARSWVKSKHYLELQLQLKDLYRRQTATRTRDQGTIINKLLAMAGTIQIEKNSYVALQRSFLNRSIQYAAPSEFIQHLKRSAARAGQKVIELNSYKLRLSQYDFVSGEYHKKPLKHRWHQLGKSSKVDKTDTFVQRDIMSAFLACYATNKGHKQSLLLAKWEMVEAQLRRMGLCRKGVTLMTSS